MLAWLNKVDSGRRSRIERSKSITKCYLLQKSDNFRLRHKMPPKRPSDAYERSSVAKKAKAAVALTLAGWFFPKAL